MTWARDPRVDEYITQLPQWQREVCEHVRELVHSADEDVVETIKRTVQPYFVLDGNICALLAAKTHVNVFVYDPTVADPDGIITHGHGNTTARTIQINANEPTRDEAMTAMFRAVIANNRAGGWRRLADR